MENEIKQIKCPKCSRQNPEDARFCNACGRSRPKSMDRFSFVGYRKDYSKFDPDIDRKAIRAGNTIVHHGDGQNVLYLDSHVNFEKTSSVGVNDDNIYTFWDGDDIRRGTRPVMGSQPQDRLDSLLVHDPPLR